MHLYPCNMPGPGFVHSVLGCLKSHIGCLKAQKNVETATKMHFFTSLNAALLAMCQISFNLPAYKIRISHFFQLPDAVHSSSKSLFSRRDGHLKSARASGALLFFGSGNGKSIVEHSHFFWQKETKSYGSLSPSLIKT